MRSSQSTHTQPSTHQSHPHLENLVTFTDIHGSAFLYIPSKDDVEYYEYLQRKKSEEFSKLETTREIQNTLRFRKSNIKSLISRDEGLSDIISSHPRELSDPLTGDLRCSILKRVVCSHRENILTFVRLCFFIEDDGENFETFKKEYAWNPQFKSIESRLISSMEIVFNTCSIRGLTFEILSEVFYVFYNTFIGIIGEHTNLCGDTLDDRFLVFLAGSVPKFIISEYISTSTISSRGRVNQGRLPGMYNDEHIQELNRLRILKETGGVHERYVPYSSSDRGIVELKNISREKDVHTTRDNLSKKLFKSTFRTNTEIIAIDGDTFELSRNALEAFFGKK